MNEAASSTFEYSLLLWLSTAGVAVLASHVAMSWAHLAQRAPALRQSWRALLLAAGALGSGLCSVAVLSQAAEVLGFPLGYRALWVPALWLGAIAGSFAVAWTLARSRSWWAPLASGALLAALAAGVQAGWVAAAGFRPGVLWQAEFVVAGVILLVVGLPSALWLGFSPIVQDSGHRRIWRAAAAAVAGLTVTGAQQVLMLASGLVTQVGSVYLDEVSGTALTLICGVLVPVVLLVMALDLYSRQPRKHRSNRGPEAAFAGRKKHRRHYHDHSQ
ncbi:MAG: hypothetical protein Q8K96_00110 [Rubrivivax sp.]|nr:hypothetical protein [Rubrivivax sp.]